MEMQPIPARIRCCIDMNWYASDEFRVLKCGHYFCKGCLDEREAQEITFCPRCRLEDRDDMHLATLEDFRSFSDVLLVFEEPPNSGEKKEFEELLVAQIYRRATTVRFIEDTVEELSKIEFNCDIAKITGSATAVVGGIMIIVGSALSLTGIGVVAGGPLAIAGGVVASAGGSVVGGTIITDTAIKNNRVQIANQHLQSDFFHSIQLRILIGRASRDESFARSAGISFSEAFALFSIIARAARIGASAAGAAGSIAFGVTRAVGSAGLHVAGIVLAAAMIPIDLAQMIVSSIRIHNRRRSDVIMEFVILGNNLRKELWMLLKEKDYSIAESDFLDSEGQRHFFVMAFGSTKTDQVINYLAEGNAPSDDESKRCIIIVDSRCMPIKQEMYDLIFDVWSAEELAINSYLLELAKLERSVKLHHKEEG